MAMTPAERADRELQIEIQRSLLRDRAERRRRAGLNTSEKPVTAASAAPGKAATPMAAPVMPGTGAPGKSFTPMARPAPGRSAMVPDASPAGVSWVPDKSPAGVSYVPDKSPAGMSYPATAAPVGKPQRGMGAAQPAQRNRSTLTGSAGGMGAMVTGQVPEIARPGVGQGSRYAPKKRTMGIRA